MKEITSFSNPIVKFVKGLHEGKNRKESKQFLLEGLQAIGLAFEAGILPDIILVTDDYRHPLLNAILKQMDTQNVMRTTPQILSKISARDNAQTVIGVFDQCWTKLDQIPHNGVTVVLDNIKDPGNLGTIMRTADATGATCIILLGETCDPYSVEAVRASMGSVFATPLVKCKQEEFLEWQKTWKGQTVATTLQGATDHREPKYKSPVLLMMGNEQKGLPDALVDVATHKVKLPMRGTAESLNVAVATGIMLYQLYEAQE